VRAGQGEAQSGERTDGNDMNVLVSAVLVIGLVIAGIALVMSVGMPVLEASQEALGFDNGVSWLNRLDTAIKEVSSEGYGSSRILQSPNGNWQVSSGADSIWLTAHFVSGDYLTRAVVGSVLRIAGGDVRCAIEDGNGDGKTDLIMENSMVKIVLQKVNGTLNTSQNILLMKEKTNNLTIIPSDSSITIDGNLATSYGSGWSNLAPLGDELPFCRANFFVNSTAGLSYDIFYTLYAGADFVVIEVRNVK
jgi:hypothetical protein